MRDDDPALELPMNEFVMRTGNRDELVSLPLQSPNNLTAVPQQLITLSRGDYLTNSRIA